MRMMVEKEEIGGETKCNINNGAQELKKKRCSYQHEAKKRDWKKNRYVIKERNLNVRSPYS